LKVEFTKKYDRPIKTKSIDSNVNPPKAAVFTHAKNTAAGLRKNVSADKTHAIVGIMQQASQPQILEVSPRDLF
jgi:hypothetical protein